MVEPCLLESKARSSLLTYAAVGDGSSPHFDLATWTAGARKVVKIQIFNTALIECEDECPFLVHPWKMNMEHNHGGLEDHVPF